MTDEAKKDVGHGSFKQLATGKRLYTQEPDYVLDPKDGLYKPKSSYKQGAISMADNQDNQVTPVSPNGTPVMNQWVVIVLTILAAVAGVLVAIPGMPAVVTSIAGVVLAICAALGIASPGVRKSDAAKK